MVINLKTSENEMDYRGSKPVILNNITVKEQRVDGSSLIKPHFINVRCTLGCSERNRGVKLGFNLQPG